MDTLLTVQPIVEQVAAKTLEQTFNADPTTIYGILVSILIIQVGALSVLYVKVVLPIIEKQSAVIAKNTEAFILFQQSINSKITIYEKTIELHTKLDSMLKRMDERDIEERLRRSNNN